MRRFRWVLLALALVVSLSAYAGTRLFYGAVSVTTSATQIDSGSSRNRVSITVWNNDTTKTLYIGADSSVTTSNGFPVLPLQYLSLDTDTNAQVWGIAPSGTIDVRRLEVGP